MELEEIIEKISLWYYQDIIENKRFSEGLMLLNQKEKAVELENIKNLLYFYISEMYIKSFEKIVNISDTTEQNLEIQKFVFDLRETIFDNLLISNTIDYYPE